LAEEDVLKMVIPLDITLVYSILALIMFLVIGYLLFMEEPTINKTSFALMLCFINGIFSYMTAYTYFAIDLYGFDSTGTVVSNPMYELAPYGMFFLVFAYFSIMFSLYCLYLFYMKPWNEMLKTYNMHRNPWYEDPEI